MAPRRLVVAAALLCALAAEAHDADVIYALVEASEQGTVVERLTLTAATLVQLAPVDADNDGELAQGDLDQRTDALAAGVWAQLPLTAGGAPCTRGETAALVREGFIELTAEFRCAPGPLRQEARVLAVLPPNYRLVLGSQLDGERNRQFAQGTRTALDVPRPVAQPLWSSPRFTQGVLDGLARALDGTSVLGAVWVWCAMEFPLAGAALLLAGLLSSVVGLREPVPSLIITLAMALAVGAGRRRWSLVAPALLGLGVGLRAGGGPASTVVGQWLGSTVALLALGAVAVPLGRILRRRPGPWRWLRLGAGIGALAALGMRLAQLVSP